VTKLASGAFDPRKSGKSLTIVKAAWWTARKNGKRDMEDASVESRSERKVDQTLGSESGAEEAFKRTALSAANRMTVETNGEVASLHGYGALLSRLRRSGIA
jgi:hypothetical protein